MRALVQPCDNASPQDLERRCTVTAYVRLLSFYSAQVGTIADQVVRDVILPRLRRNPAVRHAYAGRGGPDDDGERVIASIWDIEPHATELANVLGKPLDFEASDDIVNLSVEVHPLVLALPFEFTDEARILRVFRGQVRAGELDTYIDESRDGTYGDVAAKHGPMALFMGIDEPDRFITVSVWTAWENIEAATGGNLREPMATRHAERLVGGTATHYEIVPNTMPDA